MLIIKDVDIFGWNASIRGMRNSWNSWDKGDSKIDICTENPVGALGEKDKALALSLTKAGSSHAKYRRFITVQMDILAPLYWWKEFDTYKVGTVSNSTSTMHTITKKKLTIEDFSCENLMTSGMDILMRTVKVLNDCAEAYNNYDTFDNNGYAKPTKKDIWYQMIQLLPSSYNQLRTIQVDYEVLHAIHKDRRKHKLDEWHDFCDWIETLPFASEMITGESQFLQTL